MRALGLPAVLRTAAALWLVGHHVGFTFRGAGRIGLLPLGLVLLPGALLWRAGRWVVRAGGVSRLRHVGYAAIALAVPYAALTGALALASRIADGVVVGHRRRLSCGLLLALVGGRTRRRQGARAVAAADPAAAAAAAITRRRGRGRAGRAGRRRRRARPARRWPCICTRQRRCSARSRLAPSGCCSCCCFSSATCRTPSSGPSRSRSDLASRSARRRSWRRPGRRWPSCPPSPCWQRSRPVCMPRCLAGSSPRCWRCRTWPAASAGCCSSGRRRPCRWTPRRCGAWRAARSPAACSGCSPQRQADPLGDGRLAAVGPSPWQVGAVSALEIGVAAAVAAGAANYLVLRRAGALSTASAAGGPRRSRVVPIASAADGTEVRPCHLHGSVGR